MGKMGLILILALSCQCVLGQNKWEAKFNGFVVTEDNVKINGYLTFDVGNDELGTKILLKTKPNDTPQIFYAAKLNGYVYKKDTIRILRNLQPYLDDDRILSVAEAKILSQGKLVLYEIPEYAEEYTTELGPINRPGELGPSIMYKKKIKIYVIRDVKRELVGVKKENFELVMREVLADAPELLKKVEAKNLRFKHLEQIIKDYNQKFRLNSGFSKK